MSDQIDPNHPSIRLRVLAKTLERLLPHVRPEILYVERGTGCPGVTTTCTEIEKVQREIEKIAQEVADRDRRDECPICEFGQPLPVEEKDGKKVSRWTCGHWIEHLPNGNLR